MNATATKPAVNATIVRTHSKGVDFHSAQELLRERKMTFVTNKQADAILNGSQLEEFSGAFPCWVATGAFYEAPGRKFGSSVEYEFSNNQKIVVEVPKKFQGMKDTALALEHPEYIIEKKGNIWTFKIYSPSLIQVIENFPGSDGWHNVHEGTGIPTGKDSTSSDPEARYLWRQDNSAWVGPLARRVVINWVVVRRRFVNAYWGPDNALGVVGNGGREAAAPQNGFLINGLSSLEFSALLTRADACVNQLSGNAPDETVETLRKLIRAIEIKE